MTTTLDVYKGKSYHVLNYVVTFGGSKSVKMISRLSEEKINFLHEKVEQALVHSLYPIINSPLVEALIKAGVPTDGAFKLFAENSLLQQIEILFLKGAKATPEFDEIITERGLTQKIEGYKLAGSIITEIQNEKEIMQFLITQIIQEQSIEGLTYKGEELTKKNIDLFYIYKEIYKLNPLGFAEICESYSIYFPALAKEHKKSSVEPVSLVSTPKVTPSTHKEKLKFLLEKVLEGNSTEEMLEAYKGQKLDPKYIKRFEVYKKLYDTAPKAFAGVCKANGVKIPAPIEEYKSDEEHKSAAVVASSVLLAAIPMPVEEEDGLGVAGAINETPE